MREGGYCGLPSSFIRYSFFTFFSASMVCSLRAAVMVWLQSGVAVPLGADQHRQVQETWTQVFAGRTSAPHNLDASGLRQSDRS